MATSNLVYDQSATMSEALGANYADEQAIKQMYLKFSTAIRGQVFNMIDNAINVAPINLSTAVSYLSDAAYSVDKSIKDIMSQVDGDELTPQQRSAISELRNLQSQVFGMMRNLTGVSFSDNELRALTEREIAEASPDNAEDAIKKYAMDPYAMDETERFDHAHSAGGKISHGVSQLLQQASTLIASAADNPRSNAFTLQRALRLINQAEALLGLVGLNTPIQAFANFDSNGTEKAQIAQLKNQAETLLQSVGQSVGQNLFT